MQATQSRKASGSWRRNGQFAALRDVSRYLEIEATLNADGMVEWEPGCRWGLLRAVDELSPAKGGGGADARGEGEAWVGKEPVLQGGARRPQC